MLRKQLQQSPTRGHSTSLAQAKQSNIIRLQETHTANISLHTVAMQCQPLMKCSSLQDLCKTATSQTVIAKQQQRLQAKRARLLSVSRCPKQPTKTFNSPSTMQVVMRAPSFIPLMEQSMTAQQVQACFISVLAVAQAHQSSSQQLPYALAVSQTTAKPQHGKTHISTSAHQACTRQTSSVQTTVQTFLFHTKRCTVMTILQRTTTLSFQE